MMNVKYPKTKQSVKLMMPDELESHLQKLAKYHCARYADERMGDGLEVEPTILAEYAVDCMHEDDGCSDKVYDWIGDETHWVWDVALEVSEEANR